MTDLRVAFLDAGGTLFRTVGSRAEIYRRALLDHGLPVEVKPVARAMQEVHAGLPRIIEGQFRYTEGWFHHYVAEVAARVGFAGDLAGLTSRLIETFRDPHTFSAYPECSPVLKRLKGAGIRLAVVSNWGPRLTAILSGLGFGSDFELVLASAVVRLEKPDPAIFRRAMDLLGVESDACVHVGDREDTDVQGARSAGILGVLLDRDGTAAEQNDRIETLEGLLDLFSLPRIR